MWMQAWSQGEYAGWIWANPTAVATEIGSSCGFSGWIGDRKVFGQTSETNVALHPALGPLGTFAGFEWYQMWTVPKLWAGELTPKFLGWIYTLPTYRGSGSTKAHIRTFICPSRITIVRNATGQVMS